jgi:hypothetical protein
MSTLDNSWTDFALHPVFAPIVREMARYASSRRESVPYFAVGQPLDTRFLLGESGVPGDEEEAPGSGPGIGGRAPAQGILIDPVGTGVEIQSGGGQLVQLSTPGFYEVRLGNEDGPVARTLAVNPEIREADPTRLDPAELVVSASGIAEGDMAGGEGSGSGGSQDLVSGGPGEVTLLQETERRQGAWRFLLLGAVMLLLGETLLAARSKPLAKQGYEA